MHNLLAQQQKCIEHAILEYLPFMPPAYFDSYTKLYPMLVTNLMKNCKNLNT